MNSYTLRVGGEAGWGIATVARLFSQLCVSLGNHVFASKDYASQIKGGHNSHTVRFSSEPVGADINKVDILLALDQATLDKHTKFVAENGIVFYDERFDLSDDYFNKDEKSEMLNQLNHKCIEKISYYGT